MKTRGKRLSVQPLAFPSTQRKHPSHGRGQSGYRDYQPRHLYHSSNPLLQPSIVSAAPSPIKFVPGLVIPSIQSGIGWVGTNRQILAKSPE